MIFICHNRFKFFGGIFFIHMSFFSLSQTITEKFNFLSLSENFDTINKLWTTVANADNLFIVQEGEYILNRKTNVSPFALIADYENNLSTFRLITSLKLERTQSDEGSIGVIFMAQPGGAGGLILEINPLSQYRIRQIVNQSYKNITGDSRSSGWVTSKFIKPAFSYNLFEIRTVGGKYDVYINNNFMLSFSEPEYKSGKFGLVIGPCTKARADFLYLFSTDKTFDTATADISNTSSPELKQPAGPNIIELAESIINLKTQINRISEENEDLRKTIQAMKSDDEEVEAQKRNYEKTIKSLQAKIDKSSFTFDSLMKINQSLLKYKEMVAGNENSDLIISLSKNLKSEKEQNEILQKQNKELADLADHVGASIYKLMKFCS